MQHKAIGVLDSGLGGLTAVKQLKKILPHEDIVYFGDTGRVPYGSRGRETIIRYAMQDIRFLLRHDVKLVVAACGTVSSTLPAEYAAGLPVGYTGVVEPAAEAACRATRTGRIGAIATAATIHSGSYPAAIARRMPQAEVTALACPLFVPLVEGGFVGADDPIARLTAEHYLAPLRGQIDTLILGCTHYPILRDVIAAVVGPQVQLIDSGEATAYHVQQMLAEQGLLNDRTEPGQVRYYVTDTTVGFAEVAERFLGEPICDAVERVDIDSLV